MKLLFKICLFIICLFFFNFQLRAAKGDPDYWYYSRVELRSSPAAAGKVYADNDKTKASNTSFCTPAPAQFSGRTHESQMPYKWYFNTVPTDTRRYRFLYWQDNNGSIVSYDSNPESSFNDNVCAKGLGNNQGLSEKDGDETIDPEVVTMIYTAVYEEIINQYVSIESQNPDYLTATIDKPENEIGDEVTLWAYPNNYNSKFTGWSKDGEIVSIENPWTFTIDESNAGTYIATYKTGYNFYRFRNKETSRRFNAISDQGSITNFSSLQLVSGDVATYSAGSVVQISMHHISGGDVYDYIMQNSHTSAYYNESNGEYITMSLNSVDNTWTINPNRQPVYMADENGANVSSSPYNNLDKSKWYIEPIDKDLETCENYFSLDPAKLVEVDGKYYTTLRTSWNILFNPEQMTPYIVKSVDETEGTFEMEPISGNIIPAGTPVIIETNSNDVEENCMVPTMKAAASGAVPSGNQLVSSTKYFPNQSAPVANCKGLYKNANGQLAFGDKLSTVNGNEAYLSVADEVTLPVKIPNITLAKLLASGDTQRTYNVTDLTSVVAVNGDRLLICKDNNGYAIKDVRSDEYIDFMHTASQTQGLKSEIPDTYDQSNWIGLRIPDGQNVSQDIMNRPLKGVVGKLTSTVNPEFILEQMPEANGDAVNYTPNVYIAASFNDENYQKSPVNQKEYYFVRPKPMELANVEWAQWDGEKFIAPVHSQEHQDWNQLELEGEFEFNGSYLEQGGVFLEAGHSYEMLPAIVKYKDSNNFPHVYVLGDVNNIGWDPHKDVEMYTTDGNIYTATVSVDNVNNGYGYFSFTKKLGNWDDIKDYRFGPVADGANYYVDPNYLGNEIPLDYWSAQTRSFEIAAGNYRLTVNLSTKKAVITPAQSRAPGVKDGSNGYVVYPLQINKVTTENNGVITAIDNMQQGKTVTRVVYYNLMGVESDKPHHGINIVETRYSDGTRTTAKMVR